MPALATKKTDSQARRSSHRRGDTGDGARVVPEVTGVQRKPVLSQPGDRFEREADRTADRIVRGESAGPISRVPGSMRLVSKQRGEDEEELLQRQEEHEEEELLQRQEEHEEEELLQRQELEEEELLQRREEADEEELAQTSPRSNGASSPSSGGSVASVIRNPAGGSALRPATRQHLEAGFKTRLGHVRVHEDPAAREAAAQINARAFTHGNHIWLGERADQTDVRLMAHETTHVIQQGAGGHESDPVQTAPLVQRDILEDLGSAASSVGGFVADQAWSLIEEVAPRRVVAILREISRVGFFTYLSNLIQETLSSVFDGLNELSGGRLTPILEMFRTIAGGVGEILGALASGNCEPLFAAVRVMKDAIARMASDAWEAITDFFRPIGDFFSDLWQRFGAPVVDWLQAVASDVWDFIQDLGNQIWDATEPLRTGIVDLWTDFKNLLGIGGGDGGGGGLVGWITDVAGRAWDSIKTQLRPVIEPIQQVVASIRELLPLDAILNLRETVLGWLDSVTAMADTMDQETGVVDEQVTLRDTILPAVIGRIESVRGALIGAGVWVAGKIGSLMGTVLSMLGAVSSNPLLGAFSGAIGWLRDTAVSLGTWAMSTVQTVFNLFAQGLGYLAQFIRPIYDVLQRIVSVIGDLMGRLPDLILGPIWALLPACIKNPIKDFFVEQILSRIPIFSQLLEIPDIWARIQSVALRILQQVFVDGNLAGAAWTFFREILGLLGIPPELVTSILRNAAQAIGDILRDPVGFLINLVRSLALGFRQFLENILTHLLAGIGGWLFGQLRTAGIEPPTDFSFRSILGLVLQILDITVDRVLQRLARRIGQERVDRLRRALEMATGAWEWFRRILTDGPGAIWEFIQERISDLWSTVRNAIIEWLTTNIITRVTARLLSMLDPSGVMAVVNTLISIYQAIQSFVDYLREMMEILNNFLAGVGQIARGVISEAANFLERSLAQAIPVAIGFLANQAGLRNLSNRIREMVEAVRGRVDQAIDWLIDRAIRIGSGVLNLLQRGASAVRGGVAAVTEGIVEWWRSRRDFVDASGASHALLFRGRGPRARLVVRSREQEVETWFRQRREAATDTAEFGLLNDAENAYHTFIRTRDDVERIQSEIRGLRGEERSARSGELATARAAYETAFDNLKTSFARISLGESPALQPTHVVHSGGSQGTRTVKAEPLTEIPGNTRGAESTGRDIPSWLELMALDGPSGQYANTWVRMHLLHHSLHGPNDDYNLVAAPKTTNNAFYSAAESDAIERVRRGEMLSYETTVRTHSGSTLPETVHVKVEKLETGESGETSRTPIHNGNVGSRIPIPRNLSLGRPVIPWILTTAAPLIYQAQLDRAIAEKLVRIADESHGDRDLFWELAQGVSRRNVSGGEARLSHSEWSQVAVKIDEGKIVGP